MRTLIWVTILTLVTGCVRQSADDPRVSERIDSFEKIEKEINEIKRTVQEINPKERVYLDLFVERDEILRLAEGNVNVQNARDRALIRKMAWVTLGELHQRRPELEIMVKRDVPKQEKESK